MHILFMMHNLETPEDIAAAMEELGLNQPRLAAELDVDQATVSRWINGKAKPSGAVKKLLARMLDEHRAKTTEAAE